MDFWVKGFDPAIETFRKPGDLFHGNHVHTCLT
jgi:hypothetical protein